MQEEIVENAKIFSERLCLLLKYLKLDNADNNDKKIICDFLNELGYNIKVETENITAHIFTN